MDMSEASAMTEASGLVDETVLGEKPGAAKAGSRPSPPPALSDQLRAMTQAAPLSSLLLAFALGWLFARRR